MTTPRFRCAVLTVSDTAAAGGRADTSGPAAEAALTALGGDVVARATVADERELIARRLIEWADAGETELIVTTGGTGLSRRDVTPEATRGVLEREAPGLSELMRRETARQTPLAALSRGVSGLRGSTLIINLPGSPRGVTQCLEALAPVLRHALRVVSGEIRQHDPPGGPPEGARG